MFSALAAMESEVTIWDASAKPNLRSGRPAAAMYALLARCATKLDFLMLFSAVSLSFFTWSGEEVKFGLLLKLISAPWIVRRPPSYKTTVGLQSNLDDTIDSLLKKVRFPALAASSAWKQVRNLIKKGLI